MNSGDDSSACKLHIRADVASIRDVRAHVRRLAEHVGFPPLDIGHVTLAVTEALVNVIEHGYGGSCDEQIDVDLQPVHRDGRAGIAIRIRDYGAQVDPVQIRSRNLEDVRPGGLGVHIIRSVMDEVTYSPVGECGMMVEMVKLKPV